MAEVVVEYKGIVSRATRKHKLPQRFYNQLEDVTNQ